MPTAATKHFWLTGWGVAPAAPTPVITSSIIPGRRRKTRVPQVSVLELYMQYLTFETLIGD